MYLVHEVINGTTVPLFYKLPSLHPSIVFLANTTLILIASYVFALLVEWPSQKLARFVSKRVGF
jgi:peptidoglycan/LPS O-acetylase OafA/YrhL